MNSHTEQHELDILNSIHLNEDATQRELSEKVGLSLGAINLIIKRLTKKGFIKVVHLSSHSIKYFLTPEGIANKLERTYQYIARTYKEILSLQTSITQALSDELTFHDTDEVLFYGHEDEFKQLITDILKEEFSIPPTAIFTDLHCLQMEMTRRHTTHIITWNTECEQLIRKTHLNCINIMHRVNL